MVEFIAIVACVIAGSVTGAVAIRFGAPYWLGILCGLAAPFVLVIPLALVDQFFKYRWRQDERRKEK